MGFGRGKGFTVKTTPKEKIIILIWGKTLQYVNLAHNLADYYVTNSIDLEPTILDVSYSVTLS